MTTPRRDAVVFATGAREVFSRPVTTRNWNTIERIVRKHDAD
jgi:hypothetical protein